MKWGGVLMSVLIDFFVLIFDNGCCEIYQGCDDGIYFLMLLWCEMGNFFLV